MIIAISGTPGVGKTYLAKKMSKLTNSGLEYFDLNKYIKDNKMYDSYDKKAKTYDVDIQILKKNIEPTFKGEHSKDSTLEKAVGKNISVKELLNILSRISKKKVEGVIIDSHLSHYVDSDYCIIVKTDIKTINKRLQKRNYSKTKIKDNIESEIFQVCLDEAKHLHRNVIVVNN